LRQALEEERAAVAEKFASLDKQAEKRERARQAEFDRQFGRAVADFEKVSRELLAKIEDRATRAKVEREAERGAAELKREAQRVAQAARKTARPIQASTSQGQEGRLPPQLRGVRVVRNGRVVSDANETREVQSEKESGRDARAPSERRPLGVGDRVRLRTFGSVGIVDGIKGDEAEVRVGSLHMRDKVSNLELVGEATTSRSSRVSTASGSDRVKPSLEETRRKAATTELHLHSKDLRTDLSTSTELNLIGKKTDEAIELTDKFLDEAFLNGLSEVRIIHGHGTGALRRAISELLTGHPHVAHFAPAPQEQGGGGATVVVLEN